jgi:hypothetical protein
VVRVAVQVLAGPTVWWGRGTGGHADQFGEGHHALTLSRSLLSAKLADRRFTRSQSRCAGRAKFRDGWEA